MEGKRVIYLFGEVHSSPTARDQIKQLERYTQADKIMLGVEVHTDATTQDMQASKNPSLKNKFGTEHALFYAATRLFFAIHEYKWASFFLSKANAHGDSSQKDLEESKAASQAGLRSLAAAVGSLSDPQANAFYEYLNSLPETRADKSLVQLLSPSSGTVVTRRFFAEQRMRNIVNKGLRLDHQLKLVSALAHNLLDFLATVPLPDGTFMEPAFIHQCKTAIDSDDEPSWVAVFTELSLAWCSLRDQYYAQALAEHYEQAAEQGMILAAVYGHMHIDSLKAKLEAKGFVVIADDRAALERAIAAQMTAAKEL
ncbi:MAG TPA: hypothetical protein PLV25_01430 [Opitutales bacterium]|nr:hypothetical protein [Opitutales bacterium]